MFGCCRSEVLVRTTDKKFSVDRKGLKTLQPMAWVDQDVRVIQFVIHYLLYNIAYILDSCAGTKCSSVNAY